MLLMLAACGAPGRAAPADAGRVDAGAMVSRVIGLDALPDMFEALRGPNAEAKVLIDPSR